MLYACPNYARNSYDPKPSILDRPIPSSVARAASGESDTKRTKLTPPGGPSTIIGLVQDGSYDSLEALEQDVDNVSSEALAALDNGELSAVKLSLEQVRLQTKILAFRKIAKTLLSREGARTSHPAEEEDSAGSVADKDATSDDTPSTKVKREDDEEDLPEGRTVLTLYGSAQGPKQLFSSLQQPVSVSSSHSKEDSALDTSVKVTLPLRESSLPNIITTTQVFPLPEDDDEKKKSRTFGEIFSSPAHLPQLSPPKLAKPQTSRGNNTITFAPQELLPKQSRRSSHTFANQNLSTGHWLGYGGVDMPKDPASPTAKQKSRQRALSTGEAQLPPSEATLTAIQQAKEDALFRSAYSSFAPSRDDASAIIPEETKNRVWWQKVGEKRFHDTFPVDPALLSSDEAAEAEASGSVEEAESFKEAVENFAPADADPFELSKRSDLEKNTEEVLQEISELLETLASHQRIRNSSLATNPRTPIIQNSSLASLAGSPSTPSSEEIDVYQMLKSQLTLMISQLPPYAVAKLNGDQLEELNISRTIIIETPDHKGVLEEDQFSRRSAIHAAAAPPSLSRMASSGTAHSHYPPSSAQFGRSTPSVHSSSARPVQTSQTYYQQPSVHRSPSIHYQRSSSGTGQSYQTPAASYGSSTPRQSYTTTPFGQQTPRTSYGQATPGQYYSQRPPAPQSNYGSVTASQFYQPTPQTQGQRYSAQSAQNGYYQRPQNVASYNFNTAQTPHARTGSPLKTNPSATQPNYHSSRPGYGTPASGGQIRSTYYPPGPGASQYGVSQPSAPSSAAPTAYSGIGSSHQQMMIDRQQAQVAAQSQARMAAQNSFNRPGSGTPQPPNSPYGGQQPNGAPMVA